MHVPVCLSGDERLAGGDPVNNNNKLLDLWRVDDGFTFHPVTVTQLTAVNQNQQSKFIHDDMTSEPEMKNNK